MSIRRSARKAVDQTRLTDFFESCGRPTRAPTKKTIIQSDISVDETVITSVKGKATRLRRDKASLSCTTSSPAGTTFTSSSATASSSSSSSSSVIRREIDYDFSPTKRPLPIECDQASKQTASQIVSPVKKCRDTVENTEDVVTKRETRSTTKTSSTKAPRSGTAATTAKKMLQFEQTSTETEWLNDSQVREKLKGCKNWIQIKQQLLKINNCAEKVKEFKQMKIRVQSPVKPIKLPRHLKKLTPEKLSVAHLSPFGNKWSVSPAKLTPTKSTKFAKNVHSTKLQSSCVKRLFDDGDDDDDDDNTKANDFNNNFSSKNKAQATESSSKQQQQQQLPGYKRFNHLVEKSTASSSSSSSKSDPSSSSLILPILYKNLLDNFKIVDQLVMTHTKRHQVCTFKKLKEMVELYTRKVFDVNHLLKMQTVGMLDGTQFFNFCYTFHDTERQLCISSHIGEQVKCINTVTILLEREEHFRSILLDSVKKEHLKFLSSMDLHLELDKQIFKWHPMFKLDSVPDIVPDESLLPKSSAKGKNVDRNSILNYIVFKQSPKKSSPKKTDTIVKDDVKQEDASGETIPAKNSNNSSKISSLGKDDKFKALLEKVRAKEAAKLAKTMHRTPEVEREISMLGRMPEIIQIIYIQFTTTKAKSLFLPSIVKKISDSFTTSFEQSSVQKHLDYLLTLKLGYLPEFNEHFQKGQDNTQPWLKKVTVNGSDYLQMDSKVKLSQLLKQIEQKVHQLKS